MHNLLVDRIIRTNGTDGRREKVSLPGLMTALEQDRVDSLPALRPHQGHSLHSFLVQLAVMAMENGGRDSPPESEEEWRELLRQLTPQHQDDEPWRLTTGDMMMPAFMQPPCRNPESQEDFGKLVATTPGELDILVKSKNHEVKQHEVQNAQPDDWMMALISVQTMDCASGNGRKGASRIRDGSSSRPAMSITPKEGGMGARVMRDILALTQHLPRLRENYPRYPQQGGVGILWVEPWDGKEEDQITQEDLHPLYIDLSRRVRMQERQGNLQAHYATSEKARIPRTPPGGLTGDPWAPVDRKNGAILKLTGVDDNRPIWPSRRRLGQKEGFSYRNMITIMFSPDWEAPALLTPTREETEQNTPMKIVARCLTRHQGKTFGYREKEVEVGTALQAAMSGNGERREEAGTIAMERMETIDRMEGMLRLCLRRFLEGGRNEDNQRKERPEHSQAIAGAMWKLEAAIDQSFFQDLQEEMELEEAERPRARREWMLRRGSGLIDLTRGAMREATESHRHSSMTEQSRSVAKATSIFEGWLRGEKGFPHLFQREEETENQETTEPESIAT